MSEPTVEQAAAEREPDHVTPEPLVLAAAEVRERRVEFVGRRISLDLPQSGHVEGELKGIGHRGPDAPRSQRIHILLTDGRPFLLGEQTLITIEPDGLTPEQIETDRQATALDDADDHFVIGQTSCGWPDTDLAPERLAAVEPERRTVSLEVLTDELRALAAQEYTGGAAGLLPLAKVAIVGRIGGHADAVTDVDTDWVRTTGAEVLFCLMRQAVSRADGARADLLMPTPDVLAALDGRPDAQLLTAPVHVLALDVEPGMYLAPVGGPMHLVSEVAAKCTSAHCEEGASCVVFLVDGAEQHGSGYARTRVRIPAGPVTR